MSRARMYGAQAEKEGSLGPIADELLHPTGSDAESDESCYDPAQTDISRQAATTRCLPT